MDIYIKNMVCNRCILMVAQIFDEKGVKIENVQLGKVKTNKNVDADKLDQLNYKLKSVGFEIINDSKSKLIEKTKNYINYSTNCVTI